VYVFESLQLSVPSSESTCRDVYCVGVFEYVLSTGLVVGVSLRGRRSLDFWRREGTMTGLIVGGSCLGFRCLDVGAVEALVSVHESDRGEHYKTII
jgi:hypothetical protein